MKPLCFVLMPFGRKMVGTLAVDFDAVYQELIRPAIEQCGLQPLRGDEEQTGGIIHKHMFERLLLCEYAVADLTGANANVYYELGVRHAARRRSTVMVFAHGTTPPFDLSPFRALPYSLSATGTPAEAAADLAKLVRQLEIAKTSERDSPLHELVHDYPDIDHTKTDVFRERVDYGEQIKARLAVARREGLDAVRAVEQALGPLDRLEGGVIVDLLLSYRDAKGWGDMLRLAASMPPHLRATTMIREQTAFALNRAGRRDEATRMLEGVLKERGDASETLGLLGRIYKDEWKEHSRRGDVRRARVALDRAIEIYGRGLEADWRDAFPGINVLTLMHVRNPGDPAGARLAPVVRYAVERRIARGVADYWDYATMLELAVLVDDREAAQGWLDKCYAAARASWELESTRDNLAMIREARSTHGLDAGWIAEIEQELMQATPHPVATGSA